MKALGAVDGGARVLGGKNDFGANTTKLFDGAPTGKKPDHIVESIVRLCE